MNVALSYNIVVRYYIVDPRTILVLDLHMQKY